MPSHLILDDASVKISTDGTTTNLKELGCYGSHIEITPEVSTTTVTTFCGEIDYPGATKWSLVCTLYQSFDVDATEDVLSAAVASGAPVAYEVVGHKSAAISATNPAWAGLAIPQAYSPINGDAGDASTIELEWALTAAPTKRETPTVAAAEAEASGKTKRVEGGGPARPGGGARLCRAGRRHARAGRPHRGCRHRRLCRARPPGRRPGGGQRAPAHRGHGCLGGGLPVGRQRRADLRGRGAGGP